MTGAEATTRAVLEELDALGIALLTDREERDGYVIPHAEILDRWSSGRSIVHLAIFATIRAPDGWTTNRVGIAFSSSPDRRPFHLWLRGNETIQRAAEALAAAARRL